MSKLLFTFLFCCVMTTLTSQTGGVKVDTVQRGYYILPDTSWNSFLVTMHLNGLVVDQFVSGNKLPPHLILSIMSADTGSLVEYYQMKNGLGNINKSAPSRQYVIGKRNSVSDVVDAGSDTIRVKASDMADIHLDSSVTAFAVSVSISGSATVFGCAGNTIAEERKEFIRSLQPGQKVYFQMLLIRKQDGSTYRIPQLNYVIIE